jgi:hypothetical protein
VISLRKPRIVIPVYKRRNRMFPIIEFCWFLFLLQLYFCRFGYDGRECLLRAICEVTGNLLHKNKQNGLLGDLVHIIFTYVKLCYLINFFICIVLVKMNETDVIVRTCGQIKTERKIFFIFNLFIFLFARYKILFNFRLSLSSKENSDRGHDCLLF